MLSRFVRCDHSRSKACCRLTTAARTRGKTVFSERVVKVWNGLPPSIVNSSSLATFRNSLNKINLKIYTKY